MRLLVFGASGGTGAQVLAQALEAGHRVTAIARNPNAIPERTGLQVRRGDVLAPDGWRNAVAGHEAVLSCLGSPDRCPTTIYSHGISNIIMAMQEHSVQRLMCVTTASLRLSPAAPLSYRLLINGLVKPLYRHPYADMARLEDLVSACDLAWTIVRPPRLTDGRLTGRYLTIADADLPRTPSLSRADLAHYLLHHVDDPASLRATVRIAGT